jgi:hypothetical protein
MKRSPVNNQSNRRFHSHRGSFAKVTQVAISQRPTPELSRAGSGVGLNELLDEAATRRKKISK